MAKPTKKAPEIERLLGDRIPAIKHDRCVSAPIGCGGPAVEFRNDLSRLEYRISGLCQACQDKIWPPEEEPAC